MKKLILKKELITKLSSLGNVKGGILTDLCHIDTGPQMTCDETCQDVCATIVETNANCPIPDLTYDCGTAVSHHCTYPCQTEAPYPGCLG